jgi:hypothetical protein
MIERSFDGELLHTAYLRGHTELYNEINYQAWLDDHKNIMFTEDGSVALATYDYPGVYTLHWFFNEEHRGRKALDLAHRMLTKFFAEYECHSFKGLTPVKNRAARYLARQVGCRSYGIIETNTEPHELFILTKDEYKRTT